MEVEPVEMDRYYLLVLSVQKTVENSGARQAGWDYTYECVEEHPGVAPATVFRVDCGTRRGPVVWVRRFLSACEAGSFERLTRGYYRI